MAKIEYEKLGLSSVEAKVYAAVLHKGQLTQAGISQVTKINRTTLYPHIDSLLQANYIAKTIRGKRIYYTANNPKKILKHFKQQQKSLEEMLPLLEEVFVRVSKQPKITTYEGADGIHAVFKEAAETANYVKTFFSPGKYLTILSMQKEGYYFPEKTKERGVKAKGLCSDNEASRVFLREYKDIHMDMRLMPENLSFPVEFMAYNQRLVIVSYERQFVVVIESADINEFVVTLFDFFWSLSKKK